MAKKEYTAIEQLYGKWVIAGKKTIEDVPNAIRSKVQSYINENTEPVVEAESQESEVNNSETE